MGTQHFKFFFPKYHFSWIFDRILKEKWKWHFFLVFSTFSLLPVWWRQMRVYMPNFTLFWCFSTEIYIFKDAIRIMLTPCHALSRCMTLNNEWYFMILERPIWGIVWKSMKFCAYTQNFKCLAPSVLEIWVFLWNLSKKVLTKFVSLSQEKEEKLKKKIFRLLSSCLRWD